MHERLRIRSYIQYRGDAADLGQWPPGGPTIRVRNLEGELVDVSVPGTASCKMVDGAGNIVYRSVGPGSGKRTRDSLPLQSLEIERALKAGWLPYGTCPKWVGQHEHLEPESRDGAPCDVADDDHPCKCVTVAIPARMAQQAVKMAEQEERYRTQQDREREQRDAHLAAQTAATTAAAESIAELAREMAGKNRSKRSD